MATVLNQGEQKDSAWWDVFWDASFWHYGSLIRPCVRGAAGEKGDGGERVPVPLAPRALGACRLWQRIEFRHTLTSIMANAGVPVEVRQKFTGHASAAMNAHYTHHEIETLCSADWQAADGAPLVRPRLATPRTAQGNCEVAGMYGLTIYLDDARPDLAAFA